MSLNDHQRQVCIDAEVDPDLIDIIEDDKIYLIQDLADLYLCSYKTMASIIEDVPKVKFGKKRCIRILGRTLKSTIVERIHRGENPFN